MIYFCTKCGVRIVNAGACVGCQPEGGCEPHVGAPAPETVDPKAEVESAPVGDAPVDAVEPDVAPTPVNAPIGEHLAEAVAAVRRRRH